MKIDFIGIFFVLCMLIRYFNTQSTKEITVKTEQPFWRNHSVHEHFRFTHFLVYINLMEKVPVVFILW